MQPTAPPGHPAILNLGFRPFFAAAAIFSVLVIAVWAALYLADWHGPLQALAPQVWHGHEMIYGYAMAVIAGFLLTAVKNWTGIQTLHGYPLLLLVLAWVAARLLFFFGNNHTLLLQAVLEVAFFLGLIVSLLVPVARVRQWKQLGILLILALLLAGDLVFLAGLADLLGNGVRLGLYAGIYLVIALVLVMAGRVVPFFIERGVDYPVQLTTRSWLEVTGLLLFIAFMVAELARPHGAVVALLALALSVVHGVRVAGWYTHGIWQKPLLWVLYLGYCWIVAGFALQALVALGLSPYLSLHAFAYGGIGMITLGMMARVTLGHTGRNVAEPPAPVSWIFAFAMAGAAARVLLPLLDPAHYRAWIGIAQCLWLLAFLLFLYVFLPMLAQPRADGRPG